MRPPGRAATPTATREGFVMFSRADANLLDMPATHPIKYLVH